MKGSFMTLTTTGKTEATLLYWTGIIAALLMGFVASTILAVDYDELMQANERYETARGYSDLYKKVYPNEKVRGEGA
jgi:hypothetical protein